MLEKNLIMITELYDNIYQKGICFTEKINTEFKLPLKDFIVKSQSSDIEDEIKRRGLL